MKDPWSQFTVPDMTACKMARWAWLLVVLSLCQQVNSTGPSTASYEELLKSVKSGSFEVRKTDRLPDADTQDLLEKILEKSKTFYIANLRIIINPCLVWGVKAIITLCKAKTENV